MLAAAQKVFDEVNSLDAKPLPSTSDHTSYLDAEAESMRWFLLPSEAQQVLMGVATPTTTPPFQPQHYPAPEAKTTTIASPITVNVSPTENSLWKNEPQENDRVTVNDAPKQCDSNEEKLREIEKKKEEVVKFHCPPKSIYKPTTEVCIYLHNKINVRMANL